MADTKLIKSRGEHWVCSLLAAHGWAAALTRDGVERTDVLAQHVQTGRQVSIQVKTASSRKNLTWLVNEKAQKGSLNDAEWFVLVALSSDPGGLNRAFVIPRDHLAGAAWISHMAWLNDPTATRPRSTGLNQARVPVEDLAGYEDGWDRLQQPTSEVGIRLSARLKAAAEAHAGFPQVRPWKGKAVRWAPPDSQRP